MAVKTLLEIVNAAQSELGLPNSTTIIGNTDPAARQMLALLNAVGEDLRDTPEDGWTAMQTEFDLVVSVPVTTTGDITENSAVITGIPTTAGISASTWVVSGSSIPPAARVLSIDSATQVTMTMEATGSATATDLVFSKDTYALPSDFKAYISDTWWDRTNHWKLLGPDSPQIDQWHRSGIVATGPRRHFRQQGKGASQYRLWPPPAEITDPLQLVFEYLSTEWVNVLGAGTSFATSFTDDTDTPVLDDRALIMGLKFYYWDQKGYDVTNKQNQYVDFVDRLIARDGGSTTLNLARRRNQTFVSPANIQDGFFPGPTGPNMS